MKTGGLWPRRPRGAQGRLAKEATGPGLGCTPTVPTWKQPWTVFSEADTGLGTRQGLTISPPQSRPCR